MIKIEINQQVGKKISERWLNKIVKGTLGAVGVNNAGVSIAIVGDQEMKKLNKEWRGKNCVTDVLSFDYKFQVPSSKFQVDGEIIISYPRAARQAKERKASTAEEIKMLLIHGALHLAGYDHEKNLRQAREMEKLQNKMVKLLNS
ncbi:rRNA maturation RNase YbeY [Patescibacteria group bacterium]|nr:rRNA maturation RNase YbeY [Patescibacteria group bacterium]